MRSSSVTTLAASTSSHLTGENFVAPLPRMPAKWSTLSVRQTEHLVYFLCFVKTLRKESETPES